MQNRPEETDAWNAELYAAHSAHHREQDGAFLASFRLRPCDRVLDLGSGTGEFTNTIADLVPEGSVTGIDGSRSQIDRAASTKRGNVELVLGRLEALSQVLEDRGVYDAAVSRATLHWIARENHPGMLAALGAHLRPGGLFRAEFGGKGQMLAALTVLDEISKSVGGRASPWFFPAATEYAALLERAGFDLGSRGFVRLLPQRRAMPTFDALRGFLRSQALVGYQKHIAPERHADFCARAEAVAERELRRADGSYDLEFVRLDLLVRRA